jgi:hypothetical protein
MNDTPNIEQMEQWMSGSGCEATNGCGAEPDEHLPARPRRASAHATKESHEHPCHSPGPPQRT